MYWQPLLATYLFFAWFSVVPQLLFLAFGITGWAGPRDAILYSMTWLLLPALLPARGFRLVLAASGMVMAFCALVKLGNFALFQQELSQSVFVAIFESNPQESREFLQQFFRWWLLPAALLFCMPPYWLYRSLRAPYDYPQSVRATVAGIALLCLVQPFLSGNPAKALDKLERRFAPIEPWGMVQNYLSYRSNLAESQSLQANMIRAAEGADIRLTDTTDRQTYVLVIGESTSRGRMSLYGYSRDTSPRLSEIRDELVVYDNVVSAIPYTIESLSATLTFASPESLRDAYRQMNLVTMMKKAGFRTYWITNQQTLSRRNTLLTAFAMLCDEYIFLNHNRRQNSSSYDEVVLQPFADALADTAPRKLIIVHLLGAHFSYQYRYPESFTHFEDGAPAPAGSFARSVDERRLYNQYDNAVRYNDHVVRSLIDTYRATDPYGVLMYFADHGEEVFDVRPFNGRNMAEPTVNMYEVPFLLWPSPRWAATHNIAALKTGSDRPYSLTSLLHGWCDLNNISYHRCREEESLFSPAFKAKQLWVGVGKDRIPYLDLVARQNQRLAMRRPNTTHD